MTSHIETISVNGEKKVSICEVVVSHIEVLSLPYVRCMSHIVSVNVLVPCAPAVTRFRLILIKLSMDKLEALTLHGTISGQNLQYAQQIHVI